MIAKNIKGKSFRGCVSYVMNKSCELLEAEGVFAGNTKDMIRSFAMQRSGRKEIKQPVGHIPLSFAPEDKERMTDEFMVQLAKEYMQEMGIGNTQYIIVRHHNTDNEHLHIVYNRIDNNLKLISVNNDYKRNIKACKKLKDKYNLTYGEGKDRVKREKLNSPDKVKYYIYDAIKEILPTCRGREEYLCELAQEEAKQEATELKIDEAKAGQKVKQESKQQVPPLQPQPQSKPKIPSIGGAALTPQQWQTLKEGSYVFLENMTGRGGKTQFSSYVFLNEEKDKAFSSKENPDDFVKYGQYETRIRDKMLIEAGYITKATVKWWGGGYVYPYLWKENKSDAEYKESWGDPRLPKTQKEVQKVKQPMVQKKNQKKGL